MISIRHDLPRLRARAGMFGAIPFVATGGFIRLVTSARKLIYQGGSLLFWNSPVLKMNDVGPQAYRDAMAHFAGAVHIITTDGAAGRRGVTVIAACSVSDSPPTVLACLNRENPNNECFIANGRFALNTLAADQQELSVAFSGLSGLAVEKRFELGHWDTIATGAPTLREAIAVFDCELFDSKDLATHRVLFGKVTGLRVGDNLRPLLYHDRAYHVL